jgi:DNA-binding MarR family transcriptional regulator
VTKPRLDLIEEVERIFKQMTWRGRQHFALRVESAGLTVAQYFALYLIGELGPNVTMREVADASHLPASTMTSVVDRLVKDELVERGSLATDRRAVVATLTPAGAAIIAEVEAARHKDLVAMLDGWSNEDLVTFVRHLSWLSDGIERAIATFETNDGSNELAIDDPTVES